MFANNGSGLDALPTLTVGAAPTNQVLAGDVNRDGQADLVFVNATGVHQIWTGDGSDFVLHPEQIYAADAVAGVLAHLGDTDVDERGGIDLAVGGNPMPGAAVFLNDGQGNLGKGDITPPVITLTGEDPLELPSGTTFVDPRATATDNIDGDNQ